jgi:hypothetical protein
MQRINTYSVEIALKSDRFVACEAICGEILVEAPKTGYSLYLTSSGTEKLRITTSSGEAKSHESSIYTINKKITSRTQYLQEVYPFEFKIPLYSPATFKLENLDSEGTSINAEVVYEITAILKESNTELLKKTRRLTIYSRKYRNPPDLSSEITQALTCCICIPRGRANMSVTGSQANDSVYNEPVKYKINLQSQSNTCLESLVAQVVFNFTTSIPHQKSITFQKAISRVVKDLATIKKDNQDINNLSIDLDLNLNSNEIKGNLCSNDCAIMSSKYTLQVYAIYNIGWRSKLIEIDLGFHVNPAIDSQVCNIPDNWNPTRREISKFEAPNSNIHLYPALISNMS